MIVVLACVSFLTSGIQHLTGLLPTHISSQGTWWFIPVPVCEVELFVFLKGFFLDSEY